MPVYIRAHNLLTTGDGTPALKWGSTNAYTEDAAGKPVYDWTIVDRIFDTYLKPARSRSSRSASCRRRSPRIPSRTSTLDPGDKDSVFTGWAYPPKDYEKWGELVYQWVRHCVEKYGKAEVESWYWEVWNEPDIGYWHGTPEEYDKLYDYAADAVKRALPTARSRRPGIHRARQRESRRLPAAVPGALCLTARTTPPARPARRSISSPSTPRAGPRSWTATCAWASRKHMETCRKGFEIVSSFPKFRSLPIVLSESDPEGCAACSARVYPQNAYRNGTLYPAYTAAAMNDASSSLPTATTASTSRAC